MIALHPVPPRLGIIVGGLGRLALPGPDPMSISGRRSSSGSPRRSWPASSSGLFNSSAGIIGSVLVATGAVYLVRRSRGGAMSR